MPAVIEPRTQYLTSGRSKAGCTYRYRLSCPALFFQSFWLGLGSRYLNLAVATDLPFRKAHVCGEVFN